MPPLPLQSRRILVLRSREQSSALAHALASLGATPFLVPVLEIAPPTTFTPLDTALRQLATPAAIDALLVTSANAVEALRSRAHHLGLRLPTPAHLAAVGPSTASVLAQLFAVPPRSILTPPVATAESLGLALRPLVARLLQQQGSARLLLVRAEHAPETLPELLRAAGATLLVAPAYRNTVPAESATALSHLFATPSAWPHAIPFTSSSSVTHLVSLLQQAGLTLPPSIPRVSIGPVTSATLREHGLAPHTEALAATIPSLVDAVCAALPEP